MSVRLKSTPRRHENLLYSGIVALKQTNDNNIVKGDNEYECNRCGVISQGNKCLNVGCNVKINLNALRDLSPITPTDVVVPTFTGTIYVDPERGNDDTGKINDVSLPYKSLTRAVINYKRGYIISLAYGNYKSVVIPKGTSREDDTYTIVHITGITAYTLIEELVCSENSNVHITNTTIKNIVLEQGSSLTLDNCRVEPSTLVGNVPKNNSVIVTEGSCKLEMRLCKLSSNVSMLRALSNGAHVHLYYCTISQKDVFNIGYIDDLTFHSCVIDHPIVFESSTKAVIENCIFLNGKGVKSLPCVEHVYTKGEPLEYKLLDGENNMYQMTTEAFIVYKPTIDNKMTVLFPECPVNGKVITLKNASSKLLYFSSTLGIEGYLHTRSLKPNDSRSFVYLGEYGWYTM